MCAYALLHGGGGRENVIVPGSLMLLVATLPHPTYGSRSLSLSENSFLQFLLLCAVLAESRSECGHITVVHSNHHLWESKLLTILCNLFAKQAIFPPSLSPSISPSLFPSLSPSLSPSLYPSLSPHSPLTLSLPLFPSLSPPGKHGV